VNQYLNFDVELLAGEQSGGRETMRSRVIDSPAGGERDAEATPTEFPAGLREDLARLERRELTGDELVALGTKLGFLLLPEHARRRFRESLARLRDGEGLRVRVRADTPDLASLPWEYACVVPPELPEGRVGPECFLALDRHISLVRYEGTVPAAPLPRPTGGEIGVAVLLADVDDPAYPKLDLSREELNLRRALDGIARARTHFFRPGTVAQLEKALDTGAQILHFAGHGVWQRQMGELPGTVEGTGLLVLATEERRAAPLEVAQVAANLRARGVRLAVLGACDTARQDDVNPWTGIAGALVREGIPAVVGMRYGVRDVNAIAFSERFYEQLAAGRSIDTAVVEGRLAVFTRQGAAERDWGVPVLHLRSDQSVLFPPPPGPERLNSLLLFLSVLLLGSWFYLHLYPWAAALLSRWALALGVGAGALAGFAALLNLLWPLVRPRTDSERIPLLDRLLRRRETSWGLRLLLAASAVLLGFGKSYYLILEKDAPADKVVVEFTPRQGLPFAPEGRMQVTRDKPVAGRPFFFPVRWKVEAKVKDPVGWEVLPSVQPRWVLPVQLRFQSGFKEPKLRILRLVPGSSLPWPTVEQGDTRLSFGLEVVRSGSAPHPGPASDSNPPVWPDVRMGLLYLGASEETLRLWADRESKEISDRGLERCLPLGASKSRDDLFTKWHSGDQFLATPEFQEGDVITIRVVNNQNHKVCFKRDIPASGIKAGEIMTLCLEHTTSCLD
jgi:hypothetical protein